MLNKIVIFVLKTTHLSTYLIAEISEQVLIKFGIGDYSKHYLTLYNRTNEMKFYILFLINSSACFEHIFSSSSGGVLTVYAVFGIDQEIM